MFHVSQTIFHTQKNWSTRFKNNFANIFFFRRPVFTCFSAAAVLEFLESTRLLKLNYPGLDFLEKQLNKINFMLYFLSGHFHWTFSFSMLSCLIPGNLLSSGRINVPHWNYGHGSWFRLSFVVT